ncbi:MAG: hypothetical protein ACYDH9_05460 [Limisphaerales bacterium]
MQKTLLYLFVFPGGLLNCFCAADSVGFEVKGTINQSWDEKGRGITNLAAADYTVFVKSNEWMIVTESKTGAADITIFQSFDGVAFYRVSFVRTGQNTGRSLGLVSTSPDFLPAEMNFMRLLQLAYLPPEWWENHYTNAIPAPFLGFNPPALHAYEVKVTKLESPPFLPRRAIFILSSDRLHAAMAEYERNRPRSLFNALSQSSQPALADPPAFALYQVDSQETVTDLMIPTHFTLRHKQRSSRGPSLPRDPR